MTPEPLLQQQGEQRGRDRREAVLQLVRGGKECARWLVDPPKCSGLGRRNGDVVSDLMGGKERCEVRAADGPGCRLAAAAPVWLSWAAFRSVVVM